MACNCATEEYINKLYKEMGTKKPTTSNLTIEEKIVFYANKFFSTAVMSIAIPLLFIYIAYVSSFKDGKISVAKFFGLKPITIEEYVREQQELQNKD